MKSFFTIFSLIVLFLASAFSASFAQLPWTKDPSNPLLLNGASGSWDRHVFWPCVLYNPDSSRYEMWFSAGVQAGPRPYRIGFATSPDGISWTKHPNPVLEPNAGTWDETSVEGQTVIRENGTYKMWYVGWSPSDVGGIGYATSSNGTTWIKHSGNPVMVPSAAAWEAGGFGSCSVLPVQGGYKMWYDGYTAGWRYSDIGYATSPDGINWTKDTLNNPVLNHGSAGSWDDGNLENPHVLFINNVYHIWYTGMREWETLPWNSGWATSVDGISWNKYDDPVTTSALYSESDPVLKPSPGQWDGTHILSGDVILEGDSLLRMWYSGSRSPTGTNLFRIGHATAPFTMPVTIRVPEDLPTIQAAIDSAAEGNLILVADSTYLENINFKGKAITVASHYYMDGDTSHISNTIIDGGNPSNPDSGSVVSFISGEDTTSVLYGFTITGGSGTITEYTWGGVVYPTRVGGGIFCHNSSARISHNKIMNNHIPNYANSGGGGVAGYPNGSTAHVIIDNNQIVNNTVTGNNEATGSGVDLMCNGTLINNVISHNTSTAIGFATGGISCWSELSPRTVVIKNNHIMHNAANGGNNIGGGVTIGYETNVSVIGNDISYNELNSSNQTIGAGISVAYRTGTTIIDRNTITNNMVNVNGYIATGGGISLYENNSNSNTLITNNIISGNSAIYGGGIYNLNSITQIINNTVVNNTATNAGGGIRSTGTNPVVLNTIAWGNQAGFDPQISGSVDIQYSDVEGGALGIGNINSDPLFADTLLYNLSDSSLCIGAGIDSIQISGTWYYAPEFDYDGDPRPNPVDMYVDIGAQESPYQNPTGIIKEDFDYLPKTFSLKQNYPNPFNPTTNIEFSIPKSEFVTLIIYNLLGQEVTTLVSKKLTPGNYKYEWDARTLSSGVYFYRIEAGDFVETRKMILLR